MGLEEHLEESWMSPLGLEESWGAWVSLGSGPTSREMTLETSREMTLGSVLSSVLSACFQRAFSVLRGAPEETAFAKLLR